MALYKYRQYVSTSDSNAFDGSYHPGTPAPHSGIYRCLGCGREDVSTYRKPLPPQNHHQHTQAQGAILWRMVAWADHNPK